MNAPPSNFKGVSGSQWKQLVAEYYLSANVVKASEDKTFPGAIVASLASPWGQAISAGDPNNLYFGSYREVFARDLYEAWTGLLLDGDLATARAAVNFLFNNQQLADGSMPRNSLLNGKTAPDTSNTQLDECSYPIIMAYQLGMTGSDLLKDGLLLQTDRSLPILTLFVSQRRAIRMRQSVTTLVMVVRHWTNVR